MQIDAKKLLPLIALTCLLARGQTAHQFTAKVQNVRLSAQLLEKGKKLTDKVSVSLPALIYDNPVVIDDARKPNRQAQAVGEIDTVISYTKALIDGSKEEIAGFWDVSERPAKLAVMTPKNLKLSQGYYQGHPGLQIVGLVFQKETSSVLVRNDESVTAVNLKKVGGKYYLTDKASNDLEIAIVEASFKK